MSLRPKMTMELIDADGRACPCSLSGAFKPPSAAVRPNLIWYFKWNILSRHWSWWNATLVIPHRHNPRAQKRSCKMKALTWKRRKRWGKGNEERSKETGEGKESYYFYAAGSILRERKLKKSEEEKIMESWTEGPKQETGVESPGFTASPNTQHQWTKPARHVPVPHLSTSNHPGAHLLLILNMHLKCRHRCKTHGFIPPENI